MPGNARTEPDYNDCISLLEAIVRQAIRDGKKGDNQARAYIAACQQAVDDGCGDYSPIAAMKSQERVE